MTLRTAACSCGQLTIACEGEPVRISICHCTECQRRTGAPFGAQTRWPRAKAKISGKSSAYVRTADSGHKVTSHFCPACGSTLYWFMDSAPDLVVVALGGFADPAIAPPNHSVWERHRHEWVTRLADLSVEHLT